MSPEAAIRSTPDLPQLHEIETEVNDLGRQLDGLGEKGTDFSIRIERSTTRLITAIDELRSHATVDTRRLPHDFWNRTAAAITALTAIRTAVRAVLSDDL